MGDLSNDVSDDVLANAFNKYTSFQKARVIRDRLSQKVSGTQKDFNLLLTNRCGLGKVWICCIL